MKGCGDAEMKKCLGVADFDSYIYFNQKKNIKLTLSEDTSVDVNSESKLSIVH